MIAVILGITAVIYLSGLLGQLQQGYDIWLREGGMTGNATMAPLNFSPLYCFGKLFTPEGLSGLGLLSIITGCGILIYVMHNKFGRGQYDE